MGSSTSKPSQPSSVAIIKNRLGTAALRDLKKTDRKKFSLKVTVPSASSITTVGFADFVRDDTAIDYEHMRKPRLNAEIKKIPLENLLSGCKRWVINPYFKNSPIQLYTVLQAQWENDQEIRMGLNILLYDLYQNQCKQCDHTDTRIASYKAKINELKTLINDMFGNNFRILPVLVKFAYLFKDEDDYTPELIEKFCSKLQDVLRSIIRRLPHELQLIEDSKYNCNTSAPTNSRFLPG